FVPAILYRQVAASRSDRDRFRRLDIKLAPFWFVRFAAIHPFVSFAVRADAAFNALNEPECQSLLSLARMTTDRALKTSLSHCAVPFGDGIDSHEILLSCTHWAVPGAGIGLRGLISCP